MTSQAQQLNEDVSAFQWVCTSDAATQGTVYLQPGVRCSGSLHVKSHVASELSEACRREFLSMSAAQYGKALVMLSHSLKGCAQLLRSPDGKQKVAQQLLSTMAVQGMDTTQAQAQKFVSSAVQFVQATTKDSNNLVHQADDEYATAAHQAALEASDAAVDVIQKMSEADAYNSTDMEDCVIGSPLSLSSFVTISNPRRPLTSDMPANKSGSGTFTAGSFLSLDIGTVSDSTEETVLGEAVHVHRKCRSDSVHAWTCSSDNQQKGLITTRYTPCAQFTHFTARAITELRGDCEVEFTSEAARIEGLQQTEYAKQLYACSEWGAVPQKLQEDAKILITMQTGVTLSG